MAERPILFSGPMVRALLAGTKTQTRRVLRPQPAGTPYQQDDGSWLDVWESGRAACGAGEREESRPLRLPHAVGDLLWVRETWNLFALSRDLECCWPVGKIPREDPRVDEARTHLVIDFPVAGAGGTNGGQGPWRPSIHMPRWASRLTLEVTAVRVERLQDISEGDARAEGLTCLTKDGGRVYKWGMADSDGLPGADDTGWHWQMWCVGHKPAFDKLWTSIHGEGSWQSNPWVTATTFVVHRRNVDELLRERAR